MPIYAYRCDACGHAHDHLQKMSDPVLTVCPACGAGAYKKQLTAAGFQLKGSGWYVTDFRNGSGTAAPAPADKPDAASAPTAETKPANTEAAASTASAPANSTGSSSGGSTGSIQSTTASTTPSASN